MKLQDKWNYICMRNSDMHITIDNMYDSLLGLLADTVDETYNREYSVSIKKDDQYKYKDSISIPSYSYYTAHLRVKFTDKDYLVIGIKYDAITSEIYSVAIGNNLGTIYSEESNPALGIKLLKDIIGYIISDPMKETWFILQGIKVRSWLEVLK